MLALLGAIILNKLYVKMCYTVYAIMYTFCFCVVCHPEYIVGAVHVVCALTFVVCAVLLDKLYVKSSVLFCVCCHPGYVEVTVILCLLSSWIRCMCSHCYVVCAIILDMLLLLLYTRPVILDILYVLSHAILCVLSS